jgi:hypothetical protein
VTGQAEAGAKPGRLLRLGLPRDPQAGPHLLAFTVAAVAAILLTRALLAVTGYPQLGGGGLHVAHVLWGGLLMLAAQVVALSFAGPVVRPFAAVAGGAGFGLFIDEVGKFVTSDNDYFYRPAAAIMYAVLVVVVLVVHAVHGRRPHHPAEHLAGAVDFAVSGVAGGLSPAERARALAQLARAGAVPGAAETALLLAAIPRDPYEMPNPVRAGADAARRLLTRIVDRRTNSVATIVVLIVQTVIALVTAVGLLIPGQVGAVGDDVVSAAGLGVGGVVSMAFVAGGLVVLRRDRLGAFRRFQRAVLTSVLLTQVFQFAVSQFAACVFVAVDLALLTLLGAELARQRRILSDPPATVGPDPVRGDTDAGAGSREADRDVRGSAAGGYG